MSWFVMTRLTCPSCGASFEAPTADTVNVTRLPLHREAVLSGAFHRVTCAACQHPSRVEREFLYADVDRHEFVHVFRAIDLPEWASREETALMAFHSAIDNGPPGVRNFARQYKTRAVFGLVELAEKVRLWDRGLDDALVELLKLELMTTIPELRRKADLQLTVTAILERQGDIEVEERSGEAFAMPLSRYRELLAVRSTLSERYPGLFYRPYVGFRRLATEELPAI